VTKPPDGEIRRRRGPSCRVPRIGHLADSPRAPGARRLRAV